MVEEEVLINLKKKLVVKLKREIVKLKKELVKLKREITKLKKGLTVVQLVKVLGDIYPSNSCKFFSNSVSSLSSSSSLVRLKL